MKHYFREVHLEGGAFAQYDVTGTDNNVEAKTLRRLSKINLFVGANNSGKSRFMRGLAAIEKLSFLPEEGFNRFYQIAAELPTQLRNACAANSIDDANDFVTRAETVKAQTHFREGEEVFGALKKLVSDISTADGFAILKQGRRTQSPHTSQPALRATLRQFAEPLLAEIQSLAQTFPQQYEFKRVYIPTLRGLRRFGSEDVYAIRTRQDYFGTTKHVDIFTGLTLYDDLRELLLGTFSQRRAAADFERFLSVAFFRNQRVTLIPRNDVIEVKIGDEPQLPIFELGDGIQSIVILTFPLFQRKGERLLLFIEEPELLLHPGIQRVFLEVLQRPEFANAQYFLATHSNHLLDLTLDIESISVFTFRKEEFDETEAQEEKLARITVTNVSNEDQRSLQLLGIQNSSVFLSNSTIWVEGITDRRYLAHYLNLYQQYLQDDAVSNASNPPRRLRQDLHFSFVEYAGANITHFSFLEVERDPIVVDRLCAKLFLITDKDRNRELRHSALAKKLTNRYYCLKCREIENLLTPATIAAVVRSYEGNDAVLQSFSQSDYRDKPLGTFIEEVVISGERKRKGSYSDSGTISDKITFCQKALENIKTFAALSPEAQELTKMIHSFILEMNPQSDSV